MRSRMCDSGKRSDGSCGKHQRERGNSPWLDWSRTQTGQEERWALDARRLSAWLHSHNRNFLLHHHQSDPPLSWMYLREAPDGTKTLMPWSERLIWGGVLGGIAYFFVPRIYNARKKAAEEEEVSVILRTCRRSERGLCFRVGVGVKVGVAGRVRAFAPCSWGACHAAACQPCLVSCSLVRQTRTCQADCPATEFVSLRSWESKPYGILGVSSCPAGPCTMALRPIISPAPIPQAPATTHRRNRPNPH